MVCRAVILERTDDIVAARITFRHRGLEFEMTTRNPSGVPHGCRPASKGSIQRFEGEWR